MRVIKLRMPEKLYTKATLTILRNFLEEDANKPCLRLLFSKLHDHFDADYMMSSFISLFNGVLPEYSVEFCDEDTEMAFFTRREGSEVVITIGTNYYYVESEE